MVSAIFLLALNVRVSEITIDCSDQHPISPYIYGCNFPDWEKLGFSPTLARQGGNRMTAYNWETNASNAGNDFHHQNDNFMGQTDEAGWTQRTFMEAAQSHGAAVLLTIPTAGYVSADKNGDGDVRATPNYLQIRFHKSASHKPGGKYEYPPDTKDHVVYEDEFVSWISRQASPKSPLWFSLDNESDLWGFTHPRIWPKNPTYAQIIANNSEYGLMVKRMAPKSLVFGPANYGWNGFMTFQNAPDGNGRNFLDVYLAAMKKLESTWGKRVLDVLDIHWYPEARGDDVRICDGTDKPGTPKARIQAPRSLWDPNYVETSWITQSLGGKPIALIPMVNDKIDKFYPGTKLSISEYNYGGGKVISGALAQADVLGIFGRSGVFAACNWGISPEDKSQIAGFNAFLNYDGKGSRYGSRSIAVAGESPEDNSVYASLDAKDKNRMTVVAINKTASSQPFQLQLKGFTAKSGRAFAITSESLPSSKASDCQVQSNRVSFQAPPESILILDILGKRQ